MICYNVLCIHNKKRVCRLDEIRIDEMGMCTQQADIRKGVGADDESVRRTLRNHPNAEAESALERLGIEDWQAELLQEWREKNLY